jgi:tetratricopeptide (TPR) repeat protein
LRIGATLLMIFGAIVAWADDGALAEANVEMAVEDYPKAIAAYEKLIGDGHVSAEVYYNLAVALEKSGRVVDAVLNYRRALVLDPGLRPANNNLALLAADQGISMRPRTWLNDVTKIVHPGWLQGLGATLGWVGLAGLAVAFFGPKRRRGLLGGAIATAAVGGGLFAMGMVADPRVADANLAVVTRVGGTNALAGPAKNSSAVDKLAAGAAVGVLSPRGAWTYVELADGARGWVPTEALTMVVPGETL